MKQAGAILLIILGIILVLLGVRGLITSIIEVIQISRALAPNQMPDAELSGSVIGSAIVGLIFTLIGLTLTSKGRAIKRKMSKEEIAA